MLVFFPLKLMVTPADQRRRAFARNMHVGLRLALRLFGVKQVTVGQPPAPGHEPLLVVANHRTGLDTAIVESFVDARSLSKDRVLGWPVFGRIARARGTLFVNRERAGSRVAALRGIASALEGGASVIVFPEGMTRAGDEVGPFQHGSFAAARGRQVLCMGLAYPAGFEYLRKETMPMHLWKLLWRGWIPVSIAIGEPFIPSVDSRATAEEARRRTTVLVDAARAALESHES